MDNIDFRPVYVAVAGLMVAACCCGSVLTYAVTWLIS